MWTKIETNTYLSLTLTRMKSLLHVLILMNCRVFIVQDLALIDGRTLVPLTGNESASEKMQTEPLF